MLVQRLTLDYRLRFLEEVHARLAAVGVEFVIVHGEPHVHADDGVGYNVVTTPWSVPVASYRIGRGKLEFVWLHALPQLRGADLVIVEHAGRQLLNHLLLATQRLGGPPVAFWGHGTTFSADERNVLGESLKRRMTRRAHWWFAYTEQVADIVASGGFPRGRISVVRNSTDTRSLRRQVDAVERADVDRLAHDLGIGGAHVALFLGTLRPEKGLEFLLDAARHVRREVADFHLVIVGDGPLAGDVRSWAAQEPWIHYVGPRLGRDRAVLLRLGKVLVVPGWVGLVIVDGFAAGVPTVASASRDHPPEIDYLEHDVNGVLVDDQGDPRHYAAAVIELLRDTRRRQRLVAGCRASRERFGSEQMADSFADGIMRALDARRAPGRSGPTRARGETT